MSDLSLQLQQAHSQLPVSSYFDEALFQREMALIFQRGPRYVGHAASVPEVGDYYALPQENEAIAEAFSTAHSDFQPLEAGELLAQLKVDGAASLCSGGESGQKYLRLWPHKHQTDGFFAAIWQKKS